MPPMTDDKTPPHILITDAVDTVSQPTWWNTAKRWIRTPGALYLTSLLLLTSCSQAFVAWRQWKTMQGQLKSMNDALPSYQRSAEAAKQSADVAKASLVLSQQSFKTQQRPYVWVKTPTVTHDGVILGKPIFMNIDFINAGVTPALQVSDHLYVKFSDVTDADFNTMKTLFKLPSNERGGIITQNSTLFGTAVSEKKLSAFTGTPIPWNGTDPIYVYGRIEYTDVFGDGHWSEFCWHYLMPNQVFMNCPHHNGLDLPHIELATAADDTAAERGGVGRQHD
jgi:hypothetical protein